MGHKDAQMLERVGGPSWTHCPPPPPLLSSVLMPKMLNRGKATDYLWQNPGPLGG